MSGGGKGGGDTVVGYRYFFGIHMGISRGPVDRLLAIRVGDRAAWFGNHTTNDPFYIDRPDLFGGEKGEGGIQGTVEPMFGNTTQEAAPGLKAMRGNDLPGYRRVFTVFYNGLVSMLNPYPKAWKFRVSRVLEGWDGPVWYPEKAVILMAPDDAPGTQFSQSMAQYNEALAAYNEALAAYNAIGDESSTIPYTWTKRYEYHLKYGSGEPVPPTPPSGTDDGMTEFGPNIIRAMNGAHIIYETMTNREWGRGLSRSMIDEVSFKASADRLYSEGFGLCLKWTRRENIATFIKNVLSHIGGVVTQDRKTGKVRLTLIRGDYDKASLPLFTPANGLVDVTENTIGSNTLGINEIKVKYRHPLYDDSRMVRTENLAAIRASGGAIRSRTFEYPGVCNALIASRLAQRELQAQSVSLRKVTVVLDRRGRNIYPGDVIRIQDPSRNIADLVIRVGTVSEGFITSGRVTVSGVQDVFATPTSTFVTKQPSLRPTENTTPCVAEHEVFEMPYFMVVRNTSSADLAFIDENSAFLGVVCDKGRPVNGSYDIAVKTGPAASDEFISNFNHICPF
jgi:Putative phage tail protein